MNSELEVKALGDGACSAEWLKREAALPHQGFRIWHRG